jgi:hypothetical protein
VILFPVSFIDGSAATDRASSLPCRLMHCVTSSTCWAALCFGLQSTRSFLLPKSFLVWLFAERTNIEKMEEPALGKVAPPCPLPGMLLLHQPASLVKAFLASPTNNYLQPRSRLRLVSQWLRTNDGRDEPSVSILDQSRKWVSTAARSFRPMLLTPLAVSGSLCYNYHGCDLVAETQDWRRKRAAFFTSLPAALSSRGELGINQPSRPRSQDG